MYAVSDIGNRRKPRRKDPLSWRDQGDDGIEVIIGHTEAPPLPSSAAGSFVLCFDVDCNSGFETDGEVIEGIVE